MVFPATLKITSGQPSPPIAQADRSPLPQGSQTESPSSGTALEGASLMVKILRPNPVDLNFDNNIVAQVAYD
ncbi:MAG: hypothetical protein VKK80_02220 [Prochlorothrix sp.]|nr:hypothetical protein [Prochlorothrix sp.]